MRHKLKQGDDVYVTTDDNKTRKEQILAIGSDGAVVTQQRPAVVHIYRTVNWLAPGCWVADVDGSGAAVSIVKFGALDEPATPGTSFMPQQLQAYAQNPDLCPYCGSTEITAEGMQDAGTAAWRNCSCFKCGGQWQDVYTLTAIAAAPGGAAQDLPTPQRRGGTADAVPSRGLPAAR